MRDTEAGLSNCGRWLNKATSFVDAFSCTICFLVACLRLCGRSIWTRALLGARAFCLAGCTGGEACCCGPPLPLFDFSLISRTTKFTGVFGTSPRCSTMTTIRRDPKLWSQPEIEGYLLKRGEQRIYYHELNSRQHADELEVAMVQASRWPPVLL